VRRSCRTASPASAESAIRNPLDTDNPLAFGVLNVQLNHAADGASFLGRAGEFMYQYIDGVGSVSVVNGMAHVDLVVVAPPVAEGQQPHIQPTHHLVMALPNFVRLCAEMAGHLQRMEEKGMIQRRVG
jgi:hypothetical protein